MSDPKPSFSRLLRIYPRTLTLVWQATPRYTAIFQDFGHWDFSARDNIGFGQVERLPDTERILRAAGQGGARELIDKLPQGLETLLGRTFEGGVELSGGEWQKIAILGVHTAGTPEKSPAG
jgi:ABC-type transport system involved in cytochrome bd biosynthesis fused ATPase/permease subunit